MMLLEAPRWLPTACLTTCDHHIASDTVATLAADAGAYLAEQPAAHRDAWVWLIALDDWSYADHEPRLINRMASATGSLFPPIHFRAPFAQAALTESDRSQPFASAYRELIRLHPAELVQLLVMPATSSADDAIKALQRMRSAMARLTDATPARPPPTLIPAITRNVHYTHSERRILERLCHRHHALYTAWPAVEATRCNTARETLVQLEQHLDAFETRYT